MSAFAVVRFRPKPGLADEFQRVFCSIERTMPGLRRVALMKTDKGEFFSVAEWDRMEDIAAARDTMRGNLDRMRPLLDSFSEELGVTDPVSGPAVHDLTLPRPA